MSNKFTLLKCNSCIDLIDHTEGGGIRLKSTIFAITSDRLKSILTGCDTDKCVGCHLVNAYTIIGDFNYVLYSLNIKNMASQLAHEYAFLSIKRRKCRANRER